MDEIPIILSSILLSAFFSGIEIAYISANKFRIELANKQGSLNGRILSYFVKQPSQFIGTLLIGNNICLVVYGIFMAHLLTPGLINIIPAQFLSEASLLLFQTIISTFIILITAEFLPKVLFRINPNKTLNFFAIPALFFYALLYPLVWIIKSFSEWVLKNFARVEFPEKKNIFGRVDLDHFLKEFAPDDNTSPKHQSEIQMFQNVLDFNSVKVRECMVPRTEILASNIESDIESLVDMFVKTGVSKILIYKDSIDNIIGFVHSYEMFKKPRTIQSIIIPIFIVPETMPARELLTLFTQQHRSIALVVDEFGGTAGIVTIEDVMEEIFGEIEDEHDTEELVEVQVSENEFLLSGRLEIDYLNDEYDLDIPVGDEYETLAGFIFHHHGSIPEKNEEIIISPFYFTVTNVSETRIEQVNLRVNAEHE